MAKYFGFVPSETLQQKLATLKEHEQSGKKDLYIPRDDVLVLVIDEQIDNVLAKLIDLLPDGDKKKTMEKMTGIVKSAASALLKQLLGKAKNEEIVESMSFINNKGLKVDAAGTQRVSFAIADDLYNRMNTLFTQVEEGKGEAIRKDIEVFFNDFTDANLQHYVLDFSQTLNLGFIKRKAVPIAEAAISKGVKIGNKGLFPNLGQDELEQLVAHYRQLFFEV